MGMGMGMASAALATVAMLATGAGGSVSALASNRATTASQRASVPIESDGQTIAVTVAPGTGLTVAPATATVPVARTGDRASATFGPIVVTDSRGTLLGWTLSVTATVTRGTIGTLTIRPRTPAAPDGRLSEITAAPPTTIGSGETDIAPLMTAPPGGGGGSFQVSGSLTASDPHGSPELKLHFVLAPPEHQARRG